MTSKLKNSPTESIKTIQVSDELIADLIPIIEDRIRFIYENLHMNPCHLGDQLKRLRELYVIINSINIE